MKKNIVALAGLVASASCVQAVTIQVEFTPTTANIGLSALGVAFHDGSLETFSAGEQLSGLGELGDNLEFLAERGDPTDLLGTLSGGGDVATGQTGGPTAPGETSTFTLQVSNDQTNFSFFSMILPSNDWFVGTQTDSSVDISDLLSGGLGEIVVNLDTVYDAGTELNNFVGAGGSGLFDFFSTSSALGDLEDAPVSVVDRSSNPFFNFENATSSDPDGLGVFSPLNFNGISADSLGSIRLTVVPDAVPEPSTGLLVSLTAGLLVLRRKR